MSGDRHDNKERQNFQFAVDNQSPLQNGNVNRMVLLEAELVMSSRELVRTTGLNEHFQYFGAHTSSSN